MFPFQASRFNFAAFALLIRAFDSIKSRSSAVGMGFAYWLAPPFFTLRVFGLLSTGFLNLLNWIELNILATAFLFWRLSVRQTWFPWGFYQLMSNNLHQWPSDVHVACESCTLQDDFPPLSPLFTSCYLLTHGYNSLRASRKIFLYMVCRKPTVATNFD